MSEPTSTTDDFGKRVRLKRLEVRNYQKITCAVFDVLPGVNDIAGSPAQGKSTIPQAIRELFTKGGVSSMPLRRGAADGEIIATFDDGSKVEKKITAKGASPTRRTDAEGKRTGIDQLTGWISPDVFNPLSFRALSDSKPGRRTQAEIISEIAGLDTTAIDDERAGHLAAESAAGKAADDLEAQARGVVVPADVAMPGEERVGADVVDVATIAGRKAEVAQAKAANDKQRAAAKQASSDAAKAADAERAAIGEVNRLRAALSAAEVAADAASKAAIAAQDKAAEMLAAAAALVDPDTSGIDAEIEAAKKTNADARAEVELHNKAVRAAHAAHADHLRAAAERAKLLQKAAAKRTEERDAASRKRDCDARKAQAIAEAAKKMPVQGLTVEGTGADREVYFNGVPFSQASTMESLQVGCALALARNPKLGFLWIDFGNELDEAALEWLQGFLVANNADAFVVHVVLDADKIDDATGLIIEGGEIVADRRKTRTPRVKPETAAKLTRRGAEKLQAMGIDAKAGDVVPDDETPAPAAPASDEIPDF